MAKVCLAPSCEMNVFSNLYCRWHQYMRKDSKWIRGLKKKQKQPSIKSVSDKQSKKLVKYEKAKKEKEIKLKKENDWCCFFCGEEFRDDDHPDWHHTAGRDGDLVFDDKYIFPSHTYCHITIYHWGSYALLSSQVWYNSFLDKLKDLDIKLYNKEIRRKEKTI